MHGAEDAKGVVAHFELVATQFGVDAVKAIVQLDVGEIAMDPALLAAHERSVRLGKIDLADYGEAGGVTVLGRLGGLRVDRLMVVHFEPRGKRAGELLQFEDAALAHFRLESFLNVLEEAFDQSTGWRVMRRPVKQVDVQPATGCLKRVGVVDLGVIQVELFACSVYGPGAQQRIDEDVQILAQVIAGLDHVAAVAIDKGRQVRGRGLSVHEDIRAFLKIAHPQIVRMLPRPALAHWLCGDAQLEPGGAGLA